MDTMQISAHLGGEAAGWPESRVYRVLNAERREERAVPVTWAQVKPKQRKARPIVKLRKLIPFSGYDSTEARI
jgi:hypothetical protein